MGRRTFTTGQAAKLCAVTPDTVLKWIHSGCLPARRTAGGHHRIDERELAPFLVSTETRRRAPSVVIPAGQPRVSLSRYCWEYNSQGELPEGCAECVVYRLRAQRCYEVIKIAPDIGHTKLFCKGNCMGCEYYRRVHSQATNVMVVTGDRLLTAALRDDKADRPYNLEITDCEYACSALVDRFRPDYVVVDCGLGEERSADICHHLVQDPRLPYVRVVLAVERGAFPEGCDKEVFARIERPFRVSDISECIQRAQN